MEEQHAQDQAKEQDFINGFNNGYLLAQHEPELAAKITTVENNQSDFFLGLVSGKEQYEIEAREWAQSFSRSAPAKDERDLGKER